MSVKQSIALVGDVGAGKDSFLMALRHIRPERGKWKTQMQAFTLDERGRRTASHVYRQDDWPDGTVNMEARQIILEREDTTGQGAFFNVFDISNSPGRLFQKIARREPLTSEEQEDINNIRNSGLLVVMVDIAHFLVDNSPLTHHREEKDEDLARLIEDMFYQLAPNTGSVRIPTFFCITKIDGKFADYDDPFAPRDIAIALKKLNELLGTKLRHIGTDVYLSDRHSKLSEEELQEIVTHIEKVDKRWPDSLQKEGLAYGGEEPAGWTVGYLRTWLETRYRQLQSGKVNDPATMALIGESSDELHKRIEAKMPAVNRALTSRYNPSDYRFFAISATGNGIQVDATTRPINVEKVIQEAVIYLEEERHRARYLPLYLRWLKPLTRKARAPYLKFVEKTADDSG